MKIKEISSQDRRDIRGMLICEGCDFEQEFVGYDDTYYHQNVVPEIKCNSCGKTANELSVDLRPLATRYPDYITV